MCIIFGQETVTQKTIVIDVGHGGIDSGAIGINGIQEKDVVLSIAMEILRINEQLKMPLNIYLTRYSDTLISLLGRTKLAKALNADLFVSLHCNHSHNKKATGVEVYASKKQGTFSKESVYLGYLFEKALSEKIGYRSRGVKFANFQVLRETVGYCPSVLLEMGFLSNRDETQHLTMEENVLALSLSVLNVLQNNK
ncbi:MAG: N-acetylmuramoyl-L-alanine amidase family protein [Flavobacteriales bacterium]